MDIPRVAVVATHNRPAELARLLDAIAPQCHAVVVVDNASTPAANPRTIGPIIHLIRDEEQPPNLSRLWNVGLDEARRLVEGFDLLDGTGRFDVAVLNDDAVPPPGWWDAVSTGMRAAGAAAACSDPHGHLFTSQLKTEPDHDIMGRLCGWAFMLRGEVDLRLDESLRWWFGDTDLDWEARRAGGMLVIPGYPVPNTGANSSTVGVLAEQAGRDRLTFRQKWGFSPW